ncbi:MAG: hypothetical protein J3Q66DRAFT_402637 [Benniella sp.]|nr:MAG: hypothetical protein J3Q66DRAFT_402637 [Benniella sp.]
MARRVSTNNDLFIGDCNGPSDGDCNGTGDCNGDCNGPSNSDYHNSSKTDHYASKTLSYMRCWIRDRCLTGYEDKRNGKGPNGACCSHSDDCKDTCVKGICGVHP